MIELYRLQFGQRVTDQDTETIDSLEIGLRAWRQNWTAEIAAYAMRKRDSAFRDVEGFNVSGAKSRHYGVELLLDWQFHEDWLFHLNGAYGRHTWDFDEAGRGEVFISGNDITSAPRWLGGAELRYRPAGRFSVGLELLTLGEYYLDGQNRFDYPGHTLANLRASFEISDTVAAFLRLYNVTDKAFADRADFAMGDYRYLPGRERELFFELRYSPR
jgi:outer membrane receptor protein involved in Fe transport